MKITSILNYLDTIAPLDKCVQQDNIGLIIKGKENIAKVAVCLDLTKEAAEYSILSKADF